MNRRVGFSLVPGIALSVLCLYWAFRNVPLSRLVATFADLEMPWVLLSAALVPAAFVLRVLRWQLIVGPHRPLGFWRAYHPLIIGFFLNTILPGRVGEAARPFLLRQNSGIPFSEGLATVVVERFLDLMMLMALLAVTLAWVRIRPDMEMTFGGQHLNRETLLELAFGMMVFGVGLCLLMAALTVKRVQRLAMGVLSKTAGALSSRLPEKPAAIVLKWSAFIQNAVTNFAGGLSALRRPLYLSGALALTLAVWLLTAASYHLLSKGVPGMDAGFIELSAVMVIVCIFIALPSVPGYWGIWEAAGVFGLALFGVPQDTAAGYTLVNHAVQLIPVMILGTASLFWTGAHIRNVVSGIKEKQLKEGDTLCQN